MKRVFLPAFAAATLVAVLSFVGSVQGQGEQQAPKDNVPHKIGLIDMAHIFKNYKKFDVLREDLKAEIAKSDEKVRTMAQQIQTAQAQLKDFEEGSAEYAKREKEILNLTSDFEVFRKGQQREFFRKESKIFKTVYLEVTDAVREYAKWYHLTLVLRFSREEIDSSENPQEVMQRMNKQVVYHRPQDDITERVLRFLNQKYDQTAASKPSARQ